MSEDTGKKKSNRIWRWLPGLLISVTAIAVIAKLANWQDLELALAVIRPVNLLVAIILFLLSLGARARAWQILLKRKASFSQAFFIVNVGYLLNNLFPLRAGEIGRAVFMGQASGQGMLHVLSTIVIERSYDLIVAASMLLMTLPLALGMAWAKQVAIVTLVLVFCGLIVLIFAARNHDKITIWVDRLGERWPVVAKFVAPKLQSILDGFSVLTEPRQFFLSAIWMIIAWVLALSLNYLLLIPVDANVQVWWAGFVMGVLSMGVALPSAPAALGVYEASLVGALTILGVDLMPALGYALLVHVLSFVVTGLIGFWGLAKEGKSLSVLLSEIKLGKAV